MRVLIVEDDKETAAYLAKALREAGHVPDHAADGALGAYRHEGYWRCLDTYKDAVVLDEESASAPWLGGRTAAG